MKRPLPTSVRWSVSIRALRRSIVLSLPPQGRATPRPVGARCKPLRSGFSLALDSVALDLLPGYRLQPLEYIQIDARLLNAHCRRHEGNVAAQLPGSHCRRTDARRLLRWVSRPRRPLCA